MNATALCAAGNREYKTWRRSSDGFLRELSLAVQICTANLAMFEKHGRDQATWVHPQVAINIAQWISPKFDVKVSAWIYELLVTGSVRLGLERRPDAIMAEQLRQLNLTIEEKDRLIHAKDTEMEELRRIIRENALRCDGMVVATREALTELRINGENLRSTTEKLDATTERLDATTERLHDTTERLQVTADSLELTHEILIDVAQRSIPLNSSKSKKERFMLFRTDDGYYMSGIQESSVRDAIRKMKMEPSLSIECLANSIVLKDLVRREAKKTRLFRARCSNLTDITIPHEELFSLIRRLNVPY